MNTLKMNEDFDARGLRVSGVELYGGVSQLDKFREENPIIREIGVNERVNQANIFSLNQSMEKEESR